MSGFLVSGFKSALFDHLNAHPGLTQLLGGPDRCFDIVPMAEADRGIFIVDPARLPLVYLGGISVTTSEMPCVDLALDVRLRLYCASDDAGRNEVWDICETLHSALDQLQGLAFDAGTHNTIRVAGAGDAVDPISPRECFLDCLTTLQKG